MAGNLGDVEDMPIKVSSDVRFHRQSRRGFAMVTGPDLSGVRPNVCVEAGYALERRNKGRLLFIFQQNSATPNNLAHSSPPFDLTTFRYEPITDAAEIPDKIKGHHREIWKTAQEGSAWA